MTITEALAEIRTVNKRIEKKRQFISTYVYRQEQFKDPLAADGGAREAIAREQQAIADLQQRIVDLRLAIAKANANTGVVVGKRVRSIAEWLIWRRDVAPFHQAFLARLNSQIQSERAEAARHGLKTVSDESQAGASDLIVHVDEAALAAEIESLEETLGTLDGQLSLKNATTMIEA